MDSLIVGLMGAFVYMLRCADGTFYIGSATGTDLSKRIAEHESGAYPGYTWSRRPVEFVWSEHFDRSTAAIATERQLKGRGRAKKQALMRGDWSLIRQLSRRRGGSTWRCQTSAVVLRGSALRAEHLRMTE